MKNQAKNTANRTARLLAMLACFLVLSAGIGSVHAEDDPAGSGDEPVSGQTVPGTEGNGDPFEAGGPSGNGNGEPDREFFTQAESNTVSLRDPGDHFFTEAPDQPAELKSHLTLSNVPLTIPRVIVHIDGGAEEIDKMNHSPDHSYRCTGTMDIIVPDNFIYAGESESFSGFEGLNLEFIRGRGNSTWKMLKKPYKIKLDKKTDIFHLGANKHWALMANAYDATYMRNAVTAHIGEQFGFAFTPKGYPVDFFMGSEEDGYEYLGSYTLYETVETNETRLNLSIPPEDETDPEDITGDYLINYQQFRGVGNVFHTGHNAAFLYEEPNFDPSDGGYENPAQSGYMSDFMCAAEDAVFGDDYPDYIDMDSAVRYWLLEEFVMNGDAYHTTSTYLYKKADAGGKTGKLYYGPLWDFDICYTAADTDALYISDTWVNAMIMNPVNTAFRDRIPGEWERLKPLLQGLIAEGGFFDQYAAQVAESAAYDRSVNYYDKSFAESVNELKAWIAQRLSDFDRVLAALPGSYHKVEFRMSKDDPDPLVYYVTHSKNLYVDVPDPDTDQLFLGWFDEEGKTWSDFSRYTEDHIFYASLIDPDTATKYTDIFFPAEDLYILLSAGQYVSPFTALPEDAEDKRITWTSSDETIASVDSDGIVTLRSVGMVTITAAAENVSASYNLHITEAYGEIQDVFLSPAKLTLEAGTIGHLGYSMAPEGAWTDSRFLTSEDDSIAAVDESGTVYARSPGETAITFTVMYFDSGGSRVYKSVQSSVKVVERFGRVSAEASISGLDGVSSNLAEIAESLLTEEDREALESGQDILFELRISAIREADLPAKDAAALSQYAKDNNLTPGLAADISLYKVIDGVRTPIRETKVPVSITLTVPDSLLPGAGTARTFFLLRIHDGTVLELAETTGRILQGESSLFSGYVIAYHDTGPLIPDGKNNSGESVTPDSKPASAGIVPPDVTGRRTIPDTSDPFSLPFWLTIELLSLLTAVWTGYMLYRH